MNGKDLCDTLVNKMGFRRLVVDPCVFERRVNGRLQLLTVHVDDTAQASFTVEDHELFEKELFSHYKGSSG